MQKTRELLWQVWCIAFPLFLFFVVLWKGGKTLDAVWLLAGMAAIGALLSPRTQEREVPKVLWWSVVLFVLWTIVSFATSQTTNYGFDEVLQAVSLALLFFLAVRGHLSSAGCCKVLAVATIIACGVGVVIYIGSPVTRFVGTFFDYRFHTDYWPNAWAEYLLLLWPIVAYSLFREPQNNRFLACAVLGLVFGSLLLSYSRGGLLVLALQILIAAVFFLVRDWRSFGRKVSSCVVIAYLALLTFTFVNHARAKFYPVQSVTEKITFTAPEGDSSKSERLAFWSGAWKLTQEEPLFGYGPYAFRFAYPKYQRGVLAISDHAHNVFLKLSSERGIPAAALFLAILSLVLVPCLKRYKTLTPLELAFVLGVLGVLAHNLIDYNLQFVGIALPFWLFLGFLTHREISVKETPRRERTVEVFLALVLLLVASSEAVQLTKSSLARHAEKRGEVVEALALYEQVGWSFFPRDMYLSMSQIASQLQKNDLATTTLHAYLQRNTLDGRAWLLRGTLAMQEGKNSDARTAFEKAYYSLKYNDPLALDALLRSLEQQKDTKRMAALMPEVLQLTQDYARAIQQNTHFIALSQNVEHFAELLTTLERLDPKRASLYSKLKKAILDHAQQERTAVSHR